MTENKNGKQHPLSILANEAYQAFAEMGFEIALGPEMETEWYNFDALNIPKDHPARDMQDTFWKKGTEGDAKKKKVPPTQPTGLPALATEDAVRAGRVPNAFISVGKV